NFPYRIGQNEYKLTDFATIQKGQAPQNVAKKNQQYVLVLQYEYLGVGQQGEKILERTLKEFNTTLPMGYNAKGGSRSYWWSKENQKSWLLLVLIIVIIFFTTSILFNSLKQPLSVICVIPVSYIGVFLTFYLFKLNFDQGGFASFILLCGITVNASIYIINEYNNVKRAKPAMSSIQAYLKAWNSKIIPIFLTIVSTILGFIPFMLGQKEGFWFPLAAGTIGGLVMSMVAIFIYLPVFTLKRQRKNVE
ncbi:MAG: efflux RND transporter permease subunit, partial [Tannerellaceae bacterium]